MRGTAVISRQDRGGQENRHGDQQHHGLWVMKNAENFRLGTLKSEPDKKHFFQQKMEIENRFIWKIKTCPFDFSKKTNGRSALKRQSRGGPRDIARLITADLERNLGVLGSKHTELQTIAFLCLGKKWDSTFPLISHKKSKFLFRWTAQWFKSWFFQKQKMI